MANKLIMMDGQKAVSLTGDEGWSYFGGFPKSTQEEQYSRVAAVFRAYNLKANTIASMPFALYNSKTKEEYDNTKQWQNKVGFLPNPQELLRLDTLSLMATNTAYNIRTTDALGYKTRGLYNAVATAFYPITDPVTGELREIQRKIGGSTERYQPDDKRLVRLWRLDHTTEVLPSENTEARAIMSAAGQIYYADMWIQHFYQRGGIAPTLVMAKGLSGQDTNEQRERSWNNWLKGLKNYVSNVARVVNAEALDVKQMGSSVADLKNNEVYRQSLENIAIGTGMPLSLLLSNSANYATAEVEKASWLNNVIIPDCNWLAYEYNRQVWNELGLYMEFKPEVNDQQEDEVARSGSMKTFNEFLMACPSFDLFIGMAETFGYELSESLIDAAKKYYAEKSKPEPVTVQPVAPEPVQPEPPVKWTPNLDELNELRVWREVAQRRFKKGLSLDFEYEPHYNGLPADLTNAIKTKLLTATDAEAVKSAFEIESPKPSGEIVQLADAINKLAESMKPNA